MKYVSIIISILILTSCSKDVEIYQTKQHSDYHIEYIAVSNKDYTPESMHYEVMKGNYEIEDGSNFSMSDFGDEAYIWHLKYMNIGRLTNDTTKINQYDVSIRRHDLSGDIPTIENKDSIPVKWFGFWGNSFSADMEITEGRMHERFIK